VEQNIAIGKVTEQTITPCEVMEQTATLSGGFTVAKGSPRPYLVKKKNGNAVRVTDRGHP
jgi:hypothetical protein